MGLGVPDAQLPEVTSEAADFATDIIIYVSQGGDEDCAINALGGALQLPGCGGVLVDDETDCPPGKIKIGNYVMLINIYRQG